MTTTLRPLPEPDHSVLGSSDRWTCECAHEPDGCGEQAVARVTSPCAEPTCPHVILELLCHGCLLLRREWWGDRAEVRWLTL